MEKIRDVKGWPNHMRRAFELFALGARFDPGCPFYGLPLNLISQVQYEYARAIVAEGLPETVPYYDDGTPLIAVFRSVCGSDNHMSEDGFSIAFVPCGDFVMWAGYHTLFRLFDEFPVLLWLVHNRFNPDSVETVKETLRLVCRSDFRLGANTYNVMSIDRARVPLARLLNGLDANWLLDFKPACVYQYGARGYKTVQLHEIYNRE